MDELRTKLLKSLAEAEREKVAPLVEARLKKKYASEDPIALEKRESIAIIAAVNEGYASIVEGKSLMAIKAVRELAESGTLAKIDKADAEQLLDLLE